jgi:3-hydroxybutyryl-CoA dehydrogenase
MQVCVLGAGTMGNGIAQVSAMAGHDVVMRDIEASYLEDRTDSIGSNLAGGVERGEVSPDLRSATLKRIRTTVELDEAVAGADLAVEAIPEKMALKKETFDDVESVADGDAIVASNTSSLPVTEIASVLDDPSSVIGFHFFNPVHIMDLVESSCPSRRVRQPSTSPRSTSSVSTVSR